MSGPRLLRKTLWTGFENFEPSYKFHSISRPLTGLLSYLPPVLLSVRLLSNVALTPFLRYYLTHNSTKFSTACKGQGCVCTDSLELTLR